MKKYIRSNIARRVWIVTIAASTGLSLAGCAAERRAIMHAPGSYESTESYTDPKGTTTSNKTNTDVSVDSRGRRKQSITSETSRDPRGLMNKTTTKKTSTSTED